MLRFDASRTTDMSARAQAAAAAFDEVFNEGRPVRPPRCRPERPWEAWDSATPDSLCLHAWARGFGVAQWACGRLLTNVPLARREGTGEGRATHGMWRAARQMCAESPSVWARLYSRQALPRPHPRAAYWRKKSAPQPLASHEVQGSSGATTTLRAWHTQSISLTKLTIDLVLGAGRRPRL